MSGDLKNPAKSLPVGTFLAVGLSTVVYVVAMFALAGTLSSTELSSDYDSLKRVALVPWLVDLGVLSATLSSALASGCCRDRYHRAGHDCGWRPQ